MYYKQFQPAEHLSRCIRCFYIWEGHPASFLEVESPPSGLTSIVFNIGDPYQVSTHLQLHSNLEEVLYCGQATKNYTLHLSDRIGQVGIVLEPGVLYNYLKLSDHNYLDRRISIHEIIDLDSANTLQQLKEATTNKVRIEVLQDFAESIFAEKSGIDHRILLSAQRIIKDHGSSNIELLCKDALMSRRVFERRFVKEIGMTPKKYMRIRRFGYTCYLIAGKREANLSNILYDNGYYDQSHFIKDFKYYSGRTPRKYLKTNKELTHYLDPMHNVEQAMSRNLRS